MLLTRIIERIAQVLYDSDLQGLKSCGVPSDEFEGEATYIVADARMGDILLNRTGEGDAELSNIIDAVCTRSFSHDCFSPGALQEVTRQVRQVITEEHDVYLESIGRKHRDAK